MCRNSKKPNTKKTIENIILIILFGIICILAYLYDKKFIYPIIMTFMTHSFLDLYTKHYKKDDESYSDFYNRNYFIFTSSSLISSIIVYLFTNTYWLAALFFAYFSSRMSAVWAKKDYDDENEKE